MWQGRSYCASEGRYGEAGDSSGNWCARRHRPTGGMVDISLIQLQTSLLSRQTAEMLKFWAKSGLNYTVPTTLTFCFSLKFLLHLSFKNEKTYCTEQTGAAIAG